eukprot:gene17719-17934_t
MAGLFYMVRLFIYHTEAQEKPEPDRTILSNQFVIMERKLWYIITVPSMFLVLAAGITMLFLVPGWLQQPWMHIKLAFVAGLVVYHYICQYKMKQMEKGVFNWTSTQLRIWNEVSTIFLFAIVFLVVLKSAVNWIFAEVKETKSNLKAWIDQMSDTTMLFMLDSLRTSNDDNYAWENLSEAQKEHINAGLADAENDRVMSSAEFWKQLKNG